MVLAARRDRGFGPDVLALGVVTVLLAIPPFFLSRSLLAVAVGALMWALVGTAWNIMAGYAGQFSFGHAAFFGLGAYSTAVMVTRFETSAWTGLLVGGILAAVFALGTGLLSFRYGLTGAYFALATFAFAEMLRLVSMNLDLLNKAIGIHIPLVRGDSFSHIQFENTPQFYYYVILGLATLAILANMILLHSRAGYYMLAIREDEEAAASLGVDPIRYKLVAVGLSGFFTALGGGFFVQFFLFIDPDLAFGPLVSVAALLRPIVGGVGTVWGPLVGAGVLAGLSEWTRALVRRPPDLLGFIEGRSGVDAMLFGAILIIMIIMAPDGIVGIVRRVREKVRR